MRKLGVRIMQVSIAVLTFFALTSAVGATTMFGYQPELPKELQD